MSEQPDFTLVCPIPIQQYPHVLMAHGGGGKLMHQLIGVMAVLVQKVVVQLLFMQEKSLIMVLYMLMVVMLLLLQMVLMVHQ